MTVRAKFKVDSIKRSFYGTQELTTITLSPVGPKYVNGEPVPDAENSKFWKASPYGSIELASANPAAVAEFDLGGEYYIDFTVATNAEPVKPST